MILTFIFTFYFLIINYFIQICIVVSGSKVCREQTLRSTTVNYGAVQFKWSKRNQEHMMTPACPRANDLFTRKITTIKCFILIFQTVKYIKLTTLFLYFFFYFYFFFLFFYYCYYKKI